VRPVNVSISLLVLLASQIPVLANSVSLTICNAGKVDLDPYLVQGAAVSTTHVKPMQCAILVQSENRMPDGYIGFGLTDAKGQWGGARRLDRVPNGGGPYDPTEGVGAFLERANRSITVKHGAANATIPGLLLFHPPAPPVCITTPTPPASLESRLPIGASQSAVNQARTLDKMNAGRSGPSSTDGTDCSYSFQLTVIPYADSREVGLDSRCDPCTATNGLTPEQEIQAIDAGERFIGQFTQIFGPLGRPAQQMVEGANQEERQLIASRAEIAKGPYQMNWNDLPSFMTSAYNTRGPLMLNRHIILRGTISRVDSSNPATPGAVNIYFQEGSSMGKPMDRLPGEYFVDGYLGTDRTFGMCTFDTTILSEVFGTNFATAMVGKTIELEGEMNRKSCEAAGGVRLLLARQLKVVTPGMAMVNGQKWTAVQTAVVAAQPAPATQPLPASPSPPTQEDAAARLASRAEAVRTRTPPAPTPPARPTAPAPAAAPQRVLARDPIVDNVIQYLKAKLTETQILRTLQNQNRKHELTGEDRARLEDAGASEKLIDALIDPASIGTLPAESPAAGAATARQDAAAQRERVAACQAQANRDFPRDPAARAKALNTCMSK